MVEYIDYQGQKYPVRISYGVLKKIQKSEKINLDNFQLEDMEPLLFYGLQSGCKAEKIEMPFSQDDMEDLLDECFFEFRKIVPKFLSKINDSDEVQEINEVAKKKK